MIKFRYKRKDQQPAQTSNNVTSTNSTQITTTPAQSSAQLSSVVHGSLKRSTNSSKKDTENKFYNHEYKSATLSRNDIVDMSRRVIQKEQQDCINAVVVSVIYGNERLL